MKSLALYKKSILTGITIGLALVVAFLLSGTSIAVGEGQIEGGDIYRVRNVTKGGGFGDPASADKCETVQYKIRLHNPGPSEVTSVNVRVSFPAQATTQHVSTATITAQNAQPATRSDTATVNLSESLKLTYISGSTELLDTNSNVISGLPDGITGGGVTLSKVGVSLNEIRFVQFKAKVDCPQPPQPEKEFKCTALNVKQISRTRYDFTATAAVKNVTIQSYKFTVTRDGNKVDEKTVTTNALSADYQFDQSTVGTYLVTAVVNTDAGSTNPNDCAKQVTVVEKDKPPVPPTTPPTPTTPAGTPPSGGGPAPSGGVLPDTGPGQVAAIATLVTIASTAGYYMVARRFS